MIVTQPRQQPAPRSLTNVTGFFEVAFLTILTFVLLMIAMNVKVADMHNLASDVRGFFDHNLLHREGLAYDFEQVVLSVDDYSYDAQNAVRGLAALVATSTVVIAYYLATATAARRPHQRPWYWLRALTLAVIPAAIITFFPWQLTSNWPMGTIETSPGVWEQTILLPEPCPCDTVESWTDYTVSPGLLKNGMAGGLALMTAFGLHFLIRRPRSHDIDLRLMAIRSKHDREADNLRTSQRNLKVAMQNAQEEAAKEVQKRDVLIAADAVLLAKRDEKITNLTAKLTASEEHVKKLATGAPIWSKALSNRDQIIEQEQTAAKIANGRVAALETQAASDRLLLASLYQQIADYAGTKLAQGRPAEPTNINDAIIMAELRLDYVELTTAEVWERIKGNPDLKIGERSTITYIKRLADPERSSGPLIISSPDGKRHRAIRF